MTRCLICDHARDDHMGGGPCIANGACPCDRYIESPNFAPDEAESTRMARPEDLTLAAPPEASVPPGAVAFFGGRDYSTAPIVMLHPDGRVVLGAPVDEAAGVFWACVARVNPLLGEVARLRAAIEAALAAWQTGHDQDVRELLEAALAPKEKPPT